MATEIVMSQQQQAAVNSEKSRIKGEISRFLKERRKEIGMNRKHLSRMADISDDTIFRAEKEDCMMNFSSLVDLAYAMGMRVVLKFEPVAGS